MGLLKIANKMRALSLAFRDIRTFSSLCEIRKFILLLAFFGNACVGYGQFLNEYIYQPWNERYQNDVGKYIMNFKLGSGIADGKYIARLNMGWDGPGGGNDFAFEVVNGVLQPDPYDSFPDGIYRAVFDPGFLRDINRHSTYFALMNVFQVVGGGLGPIVQANMSAATPFVTTNVLTQDEASQRQYVYQNVTIMVGSPPSDPNKTKVNDPKALCSGDTHAMPRYNIHSSVVSLNIEDTPLSYHPPVGPPVGFTVTYNQREANQPATFTYSNFGPKWTFNWLSYVTDDPANLSADTSVYVRGGGTETFSHFDAVSQSYAVDVQSHTQLVRTSGTSSPATYEKRYPDGSKEVFTVSDGSATFPRKIFLTQVVDPVGNAVTLAYDSSLRVTTITDAIGQATVLQYGATDPLKITKVTDPFGRYAQFDYDSNNQLHQITDEIGIASQLAYDTGSDFINTLTTPYGATTFSKGENGTNRWLQITDPNAGVQRVEYRDNAPGINGTEVTAPAGVVNNDLQYANTFYWDRKAMMSMSGTIDYTKAKITHWLYSADASSVSSIPSSEKSPLESRVWYQYPGQTSTENVGTSSLPSVVSRILDDGSTQKYQYQYNALGKVTQTIDPVQRAMSFDYASNNIDLLHVRQITGSSNDLLTTVTYNGQHLPLTVTDAAGQITTYTYTSVGQLNTLTNAKSETTTWNYSGGYLQNITGPVSGAVTSFSYDSFKRVQTVTDSQSYVLTYDYDSLNRLIKTTYPDGSYGQITYDFTNNRPLDIGSVRDRAGRLTYYTHDALQHLTAETDPANRTTAYTWCSCGALESMTDANGSATTWLRDIQSRPTTKTYADGSTEQYVYENTTSRTKKVTDRKGQVTNYSYFADDNVQSVSYTNAAIATAGVSYTYDANYNRISTMVDGTGTTAYAFNPITPAIGSGRLASITGPLANSAIAYTYDQLGRVLTRTINGNANSTGTAYDSLGRITSVTNPLGTFGLGYVAQTGRLSSISYPNGQSTVYDYHPNSVADGSGNEDDRLKQIKNLDPSSAALSQFDYTYDVTGRITKWTQTNSGQTSGAQHYDFANGYDDADQLTSAPLKDSSNALVKQYGYGYDLVGNRLTEQAGSNSTTASYNNLNQLINRTGSIPSGTGPVAIEGTLDKVSKVTVGGTVARVSGISGGYKFAATLTLGTTGTNSIPIVATDGSGNTTSKTLTLAGQYYGYDANGNMTSDSVGKTYEWDAVNRLVAINYLGTNNRTEFTYNGLSQRVKIVEKSNGTVTSTKQFVWVPDDIQPSEERDASNTVTKRFFPQGEQIGGSNYFYTKDHLGSIREMTDASGAIHARYDYDPYGRLTKISGDLDSDFMYAGYYNHSTSGLELTRYRLYNPDLGRWLSRDPIEEDGGINLYGYVVNNPTGLIDPLGLAAFITFTNGKTVSTDSTIGFQNIVRNSQAGSIRDITISGSHGNDTLQQIGFTGIGGYGDPRDEITIGPSGRPLLVGGNYIGNKHPVTVDLGKLLAGKFASGGTFHYNGCHTGDDENSSNLANATSKVLPNIDVSGARGYVIGGIDSTSVYSPSGYNSYRNGGLVMPNGVTP